MKPVLTIVLIAAVIAYVVFAWRYFTRKRAATAAAGTPTGSVAPRTTPMPSSPPVMPLSPDGSPLTTAHDRPPAFGPDSALPDRPPQAPVVVPAPPMPGATPSAEATPATGYGPESGAGRPMASRVVDLVSGIRLPEELVPLVDVIPRPAAVDRVVFMTLEAPAGVIRDGLVAALEAIGTDARWSEEGDKALLRRGGHTGWLEIHRTPGGIVQPGTLMFPTLPDHAVTVEFWTEIPD